MRRLLLCLTLALVVSADAPEPKAPRGTELPDVAASDKPLPGNEDMEKLARTDPVAFVKNCISRYNKEVKGYRCTLKKQERIDGVLGRSSILDVSFREEPFSVLMRWKEGGGAAQAVLYVKGENKDRLLALPTGFLARVGPVERDVNGEDARKTSRYPINQFGIKVGMQRTLADLNKSRDAGDLRVEYLGQKRIKELNNRLCFVLKYNRRPDPAKDNVAVSTLYYDTETWLQIGSTLKDPENRLVGEYLFRDVQLNPSFPASTFTRAGLAGK